MGLEQARRQFQPSRVLSLIVIKSSIMVSFSFYFHVRDIWIAFIPLYTPINGINAI